MDWTELRTRQALKAIGPGRWQVEDTLELAGGGHATLRLDWTLRSHSCRFDFFSQ